MLSETKTCKSCKFPKLKTDFPSSGWWTAKDGTKHKSVKPECKDCHNRNVLEKFAENLKTIGIEFKCVRCGYDNCKSAIDFHHKDPTKKDFRISGRTTASLKTLQEEINKCIILCKICHVELHAGMWQLENLGL